MKKEIVLRYIKFGVIIIASIILIFIFINNKYDFYTSKELFDKTNIVLEGKYKNENIPVTQIEANSNVLPYLREKEIEISNLDKINNVYNVFEVDELSPYENYDVTLEFQIKGIPMGTKISVGSQEKKVEELINEGKKESTILVNIDEKNSSTFFKGDKNYMKLPVKFTTNSEGKAYIYFGISTKDINELDYAISQVRILK